MQLIAPKLVASLFVVGTILSAATAFAAEPKFSPESYLSRGEFRLAVFNRDETRLLTATAKLAQLWDLKTGAMLQQCEGHAVCQPFTDENKTGRAVTPRELKSKLEEIPSERGGGYILDSFQHEFSDETLEQVVKISGIRVAYASEINPDARVYLGKIETLEELYIDDMLNNDHQLQFLDRLRHLEALTLHGWYSFDAVQPQESRAFSGAPLACLKNMPELRQLTLTSNRLDDDALTCIENTPGLLCLNISGHFTSKGLKQLEGLKGLKRLKLTGHFDDTGLAHLAQLTNLESLALTSDQLNGDGLIHLSRLPKLKMLMLSGFRPDMSLAHLSDLPALESLNLGTRVLTDTILLTLPESDSIKSLSLSLAAVTDRGLAALPRLHNLEELDLLINSTTDEGLDVVSSLSTLRALCLGDGLRQSSITEVGLRKLARLPELERLDLRYVNLVDVELQVLAIPSLTMLHLEGIERYEPKKEEIRILHSRLPRLARPSSRVVIKANLINEPGFHQYDIYDNCMEVKF